MAKSYLLESTGYDSWGARRIGALEDLSSKQIIRPILPLTNTGAKHANGIIALCYLAAVVMIMILEFSGWTYSFSIWPLSSLIPKVRFVLLTPVYSIFGLLPISRLSIAVGLILVIDTLVNGLDAKKLVVIVAGTALSCILFKLAFNDRFAIFLCFVATYPCKLKLRNAIWTYLVTGMVLTLFTICMALLGQIATVVSFEHGVLRHSLGFTYTNGFAVTSASLIMAWVYLKAPTWRWQDSCISIALALIVLTISDGRSACAFVLLQIILTSLLHFKHLAIHVKKACEKALYWLATWLFPILAVLSLACLPVLAAMRQAPLYDALNTLLSTRLDTWLDGFARYGYPLVSKPFETTTYCDNSFLHILWTCGIAALVFFAVLYVLTGTWTRKQKDLALAIYITIFVLHCFTEILVYEFNMGFIILVIGAALSNAVRTPSRTVE